MRRLSVVVLVALAVLCGWAPQAPACDALKVMGLPESCQQACKGGWHYASYNNACMIDILIGW
jgi:hypothetical protein